MPATLTKNGDVLEVSLTGRWSEISDAKEKVRDIPGRQYDGDRKLWILPAEPHVADRILKTIRPTCDEALLAWVRESMVSHEESLTSPVPDDAQKRLLLPWAYERQPWQPEFVNDEEFTGLLPYQRAGVEAMKDRALLADDMGLGKTIQAIAAVSENLLQCSYEAAALIEVGYSESRRASETLSRLLTTLSGKDTSGDLEGERQAVRRLWDQVTRASNGLGPHSGGEIVFSWAVDEEQRASRFRVARGSDPSRDFEVRGTLPELPPDAPLSLGAKLVVAPASVMGSWRRELERWLKEPAVSIIDGGNPKTRHAQIQAAIKDKAWIIINWEQLRIKRIEARTRNGGRKKMVVMKEPLFQYPQAAAWDLALADWDMPAYLKAEREFGQGNPRPWAAVIADEAHRAKNKDAQQTRGLHRVQGHLMYGASGTPMMNSPDELWSLLRWLWPDEYHEHGARYRPGAVAYWPFYMTYVEHWEDHNKRKVVTGVRNPDALRFALRGKLIRRTASILGLKGRKRFFFDVPLTATQEKLYREAEKAMWLAISKDAEDGDKTAQELLTKAVEGASAVELMRIPNGAARFVRLLQIIENTALLGGPDSSANMDDFEQKFVDSRPSPWLVYCKYRASCEILADRLRRKYGDEIRVAIYNGDVPTDERTEIENAFQSGAIDVLIGTIDAMYQGITLTYGHLQYWLSRAVVPAINEQGEARQDRLGQQEMVRVYVPQPPGTVATGTVHVINRLKEGIVKTVLPQDEIKEGTI